MQFIYSDLGQRHRGDVVEVVLRGNEANVALLDSSNYSAFKSGRKWRGGVGGLAKRSPIHLTVPRTGHWYGPNESFTVEPDRATRTQDAA